MRNVKWTGMLLLGWTAWAQSRSAPPTPRFEDVSTQAGLTVSHISSPDKRYVIESMSGGVGFIDCDNDGKLDIITVNGSSVEHYKQGGDPMITLYRQEGDLKFKDMTEKAGVAVGGFSTGASWGDFDRDGRVDLFVPRYVFIDINKLPEFGSNDKFCRFRGILVQCGPGGL